jgi:transcriptional regulator with XRE-family HTH domain
MCGVSRTLITEIEGGTRNARPALIKKLAEALNCPRVILERKREPEAPSPANVDLHRLRHAERTVQDDLPERGQPRAVNS